MKVLLPVILLLSLAACSQKEVHDETWMNSQIDSIVGTRMEEINTRAMEDLDHRMSIVLKQKTDSIIAARQAGARPADTLTPPSQPMP
jgi:hypothetical protein